MNDIKALVMGILKQYGLIIALAGTVLLIMYLGRKKILGTLTETFAGESLEEFKADVQTIQETTISSLASDIWTSVKASLPGGTITAEEYQAWKEEQMALRATQ